MLPIRRIAPPLLVVLATIGLNFATITACRAESQLGSVTLRWTAPGDDSTLGRAARYDLRYSLIPITLTGFALATPVTGLPTPGAPGSIETFTVPTLLPGVSYYFAIKTCDEAGNWSKMSNVALAAAHTTGVPVAAAELEFSAPRPNPSPQPVTFSYSLPHAANVAVEVYDVFGRVVRRLANGFFPASQGDLVWDLGDERGTRVRPGVYLVRARLAGVSWIRRVVVTG